MSDWEVVSTRPTAPSGDWAVASQRPQKDSPLKQGLTAPFAPGEALANLVTGAATKPIADLAGMFAIPMHAAGFGAEPAKVQRDVQDTFTYEPRTTQGKLAAEYNPLALLGRLFDAAGDATKRGVAPAATSGPARDAAGNALAETVRQLPGLVTGGAKPAAASASTATKGKAQWLMNSALKPNAREQVSGRGPRAVDTLLNQGISVTRGGADKLRGIVESLDTQIGDKIASSTATIDKTRVTAPIDEAISRFTEQVNPNADVSALTRSKAEFMEHPSLPRVTPARTVESPILDASGRPYTTEIPASGTNQVPVQQAHDMKRGTYRALGDKAYGELKGAEIEGQKSLARGLKDEVAAAVPEVAPLNAMQSEMLNALPILERRVLMEMNKNPAGLGLLARDPVSFGLWLADRSAPFKSIVARMLNTTAEALPGAAATIPAVGAIVQGYRFNGGDPHEPASWEPVQQ